MSRSTSPIASVTETCQVISVSMKLPSRRYIDEFLRIKCAPDLLAARVFPNGKEVTESMAAFDAVRKYVGVEQLGNREWLLIDVGCGATPRTAALFAYRTVWDCLAVDPKLRPQQEYSQIEHMLLYRKQIEQMGPEISKRDPSKIIAVAVHAHVRLSAIMFMLKKAAPSARVVLVAIPCCISQELPIPPRRTYVDWGIWSPKREVKIWDM